MAVLDYAKKALSKPSTQVEKPLQAKIDRGRERLESIAATRDEAWEFFRGNHYAYIGDNNKLVFLQTTTSVRLTGKPPHRARQKRNLIFDVVLRAASAAGQRIPSYEVVPSGHDPEKESAAALAEKVLLYGHQKWQVRKAAVDAIIHATVAGEAFAWPYFDNRVGQLIDDGKGNLVGTGEICVRVFGANECFWEPGVPFDLSPWHVIEQARPLDEVKQMEGYVGGELTADADTRQLSHRGSKASGSKRLVLVTEYLERPSPAKPEGRWITMANRRVIVAERPYPGNGERPVLRKLEYAPDPDSDRAIGLVPQLLDAQRTHNDANNKAIEWKNHCLVPRLIVAPGLMKKQRWTDEPGKVYEIPDPERNVKVVETPTIPPELFEMADRAQQDIGRISANNDIPSGVTASSAVQSLLDSDSSRMAMFLAGLAEWYSDIGHDCLQLVQQHYTEPRLLSIRGDFGWESIEDFIGAHLQNELDVRVFPEGIEPQTREGVEQRVQNLFQMGAITPEEAASAIERGSSESLLRSISFDQGRAGRIIQRIKAGPDVLFSMPYLPTGQMVEPQVDPMTGQPAIDPMTGQPVALPTNPVTGQTYQPGEAELAPGWMPRYSDNITVMKAIFEDWMKTEEFERLEPDMQTATAQIYAKLLQLEAQKAQAQAEEMNAQAADRGMQNAAAPPVKPMPSMPSVNGNQS